MIESPYENNLIQVVTAIQTSFLEVFEIDKPFRSEELAIGEIRGLISAREWSARSNNPVIQGVEKREVSLDALLILSVRDRLSAEATALVWMARLEHGIAAINQKISEDTNLKPGTITTAFRIAIKEPHNYYVDITCPLSFDIWIRRDSKGNHITF